MTFPDERPPIDDRQKIDAILMLGLVHRLVDL